MVIKAVEALAKINDIKSLQIANKARVTLHPADALAVVNYKNDDDNDNIDNNNMGDDEEYIPHENLDGHDENYEILDG